MEKQLGWDCKLVGVEPLWITKVGPTVLARLMESQIWHQPTSCVWGELSKESVASAHPDATHFSFSLHTTGALQAATPVFELRGSKSEQGSLYLGSPGGTA